jgi:RES domain-containing protein
MRDRPSYRLVKTRWLDDAFTGAGARRYGGRWNSKGTPCIYLAGSISLAMLEVMVHLDDYRLLEHYAVLEVRLPEKDLLELPPDQLPDDWRDEPAPGSTAELGDDWLASVSSLVLAVPSVVVPQERNYLLNPEHPGFAEVVATAVRVDYQPDSRLCC